MSQSQSTLSALGLAHSMPDHLWPLWLKREGQDQKTSKGICILGGQVREALPWTWG